VIKPGRICNEPVCQIDLLATCADIINAKLPSNAGEDSYSLLSAMKGEAYSQPLRGPIIHHSGSGYFAIRDGQWKLNLFRGSGGSLSPKFIIPKSDEPVFELYDMKNDWRETTNVCDQHPDVVNRLKELATKIIRNGRSTPGKVQKNDGDQLWPELTWIPEAASLKKKNRHPINNDNE
jgi:arylsulfatase A